MGSDLFRVKKISGKIFGKRYYSGKKGVGVKNFWDFFDWRVVLKFQSKNLAGNSCAQ